jgi:hypothetical protein
LERVAFGVVGEPTIGRLRQSYPEPHDRIGEPLGDLGNVSRVFDRPQRQIKIGGRPRADNEWLSVVDRGAVWA